MKKESSMPHGVEISEICDVLMDDSPDETAIKNDRINALKSAMDKLSLEHKEIIVLRDIEGYSYEEIASMLSLEGGTVKSRINRARSALRKLLCEVEQK